MENVHFYFPLFDHFYIDIYNMKESKIFFLFLVSQHFFDKSCRYSNSVDRFFNVAEIINPLFSNDAAAEK